MEKESVTRIGTRTGIPITITYESGKENAMKNYNNMQTKAMLMMLDTYPKELQRPILDKVRENLKKENRAAEKAAKTKEENTAV